MLIPNFSGGLITNAGDHASRNRENYAAYCRECRTDEQGWLMRRDGRIQLSDETRITEIFTHKTVVLAVIGGDLKWSRTSRIGEQLNFRDFVTGGYRVKDGSERVVFEKQGDFVYLSTGKASFVVEIPTTVNPENPADFPTVRSFYVPPATSYSFTREIPAVGDGYETVNVVIQAVVVEGDQEPLSPYQGAGYATPELAKRVAVAEITEPFELLVRRRTSDSIKLGRILTDLSISPNPFATSTTISLRIVVETPLRVSIRVDSFGVITPRETKKVLHDSLNNIDDVLPEGLHEFTWDGTDSDGNTVRNGAYEIVFETQSNSFTFFIFKGVQDAQASRNFEGDRTVLTFQKGAVLETEIANYYDFYATSEDGHYVWIARIPNRAGQQLFYRFDYDDNTGMELVEPLAEKIHFQHIEVSKFRTYAAKADSNEIYLSYYDPSTLTQLYQNFTDVIPVELGGGKITGLRFIRDNLLAIYATNQIQLMATDPLAELHSVIDELGPNDEEGNPIGCNAPDSIVDMGGEHYFLASNGYVHRFTASSIRTISDPVQAIFHAIHKEYDEVGQVTLSKAVGFAYDRHYFISIPSILEENPTDLPNTTLLYSMQYGRWWQDGFGIRSIAKLGGERLYGIVDGQIYELYEGDDDAGVEIRRIWRSNPELRKAYDLLECVNVFCQGSAEIDVTAITEEGRETNHLSVEDAFAFYDQRAGFFLHGRTHTVEIALTGDAKIDRIATNERLSQ